jgi:broad specificity phosphatase PhoE
MVVWTSDTEQIFDQELIANLRSGGYTIYFRHAQTDWTQNDLIDREGDWTSCDSTRVRQLSEEGRQTAMAVGQAIRDLQVPIGRVLSSPYCRAVETARLMRIGPVAMTNDVMNLRVAEYFGGREAIVERARALLSTPPEEGTNTIIVAHGNVAREATPVYPDEAEGIVFRPLGNGNFSLVSRLTPSQWAALLN